MWELGGRVLLGSIWQKWPQTWDEQERDLNICKTSPTLLRVTFSEVVSLICSSSKWALLQNTSFIIILEGRKYVVQVYIIVKPLLRICNITHNLISGFQVWYLKQQTSKLWATIANGRSTSIWSWTLFLTSRPFDLLTHSIFDLLTSCYIWPQKLWIQIKEEVKRSKIECVNRSKGREVKNK